jgi:hypothetical protein
MLFGPESNTERNRVPSPPAKIKTGMSETPLLDLENGFIEDFNIALLARMAGKNDN